MVHAISAAKRISSETVVSVAHHRAVLKEQLNAGELVVGNRQLLGLETARGHLSPQQAHAPGKWEQVSADLREIQRYLNRKMEILRFCRS